MFLASCGGGGGHVSENTAIRGYNPGVGPFDSRGNYVERWADDKSKGNWWRESIISDPAASTPAPVVAATTTLKPSPPATASAPKPPVSGTVTPIPTVASAPKPAPVVRAAPQSKAPIRYTVKKGDTLWAISRKYGTTVSAIQRANGIKGTNLSIGRTLLIPRY